MPFRIPPFTTATLILIILTLTTSPHVRADVESLQLIDAHASLHGEIAKAGLFREDDTIDLVFVFDLDATDSETAELTWDVYNRYDRVAHSGSIEQSCQPGMNTLSVANAIPVDLGSGTQNYRVYASITVDGEKADTEFEIRIESPQAFPGLYIEDVRLLPRDDNSAIAEEMAGAAIAYTLEIDFRTENIISWAHAQIRWLGTTSNGYELDRGLGSINVDEGFNTFTVDSYIARPPYGSTPEADFSVEVYLFGYVDSVTFPITSLPISLIELRSRQGVTDPSDFSVGEAYLYGNDGARTSLFQANETITARILTGGPIPENTTLMMQLRLNSVAGGTTTDDVNSGAEQFVMNLEPGLEMSVIEYELPSIITREPGYYDFQWAFVIDGFVFAERRTNITISGREGIVIPQVIDLPGGITFTIPLTWNETGDGGGDGMGGVYVSLMTPDNVQCKLISRYSDEPLNVELYADIFESDYALSGIPPDAVPLTSDSAEIESILEYTQRAYLGDGKVFVYDYWLVRGDEDLYIYLTATSIADESNITGAYAASGMILYNLDFSI